MRKTIALSLLAATLSACTVVGPDYVRPQIESPEHWRIDYEQSAEVANAEWWKQFDDPVLDDLVITALHNNHDLLIATARIEEFAGRYGIVRAELFPQVGAGYEASRQRSTLPGASSPSSCSAPRIIGRNSRKTSQ